MRTLKLGTERHISNLSVYLIPILSILLQNVMQLSNYMENLENTLPALDLIENIVKIIDKEKLQAVDMELIKKSVEDFNLFYVKMCELMT